MPKRALIPLKLEVFFNYSIFSRWHKVTRMAQSFNTADGINAFTPFTSTGPKLAQLTVYLQNQVRSTHFGHHG